MFIGAATTRDTREDNIREDVKHDGEQYTGRKDKKSVDRDLS
jgi:hypothetical protein